MNAQGQATTANANAPPLPATNLTESLASALASQLRAFPQQLDLSRSNGRGVSSRNPHGPGPSGPDLQRWMLGCHMRKELLTLEQSYSVLRRNVEGHGRPSPDERAAFRQTEASLKSLTRMQEFILHNLPLNARPTMASAVKA